MLPLEASRAARRAGERLLQFGMATFVLAAAADVVVHLAGQHPLEPAAHLGIFAGMAAASAGLVLTGIVAQRKERTDAHR